MVKSGMTERKLNVFAFALIGFGILVSCCERAGAGYQEQQSAEPDKQMQVTALRAELELLQTNLELDNELIERLFATMKMQLETAAASADDSESMFANRLDFQHREQLLTNLLDVLPDDQHEAARQYLVGERLLQEIVDRNTIEGVLIYLDNQLCLSPEQYEKLGAHYSENWDSQFSQKVHLMVIYGMSFPEVIDVVAEADFQEILSKTQFSHFQKLSTLPTPLKLLEIAVSPKQNELNSDAFKAMCETAVEARIDELKRIVNLDEGQEKRFNIGRKGSVSQVTERWTLLVAEMNKQPAMNFELRASITEPLVAQVSRAEAWQQILAKSLNEEQLQEMLQRERIREQRVTENLIEVLTLMMYPKGLPAQYSTELHGKFLKMLQENVELKYARDYLTLSQQLAAIDDSKFLAIMDEKQWETFKPGLEQHRAKIQAMAAQMQQFGADDQQDDEPDDSSEDQ